MEAKIENQISTTKSSLAAEKEKIKSFIEANEKRLELLYAELNGFKGRLIAARNNYERSAKLFKSRASSQTDVDINFGIYMTVLGGMQAKEKEIEIQKFLIKEGKKGRLITGYNSDFAGLSIEASDSTPYIAARFTSEDAKYLYHGAECLIVVVPREQVFKGKITAIGHSGLNAIGSVSVDDESSLAEIPVKISLPDGVKLKNGEGVFVKVKRNWSFKTYLQRLF